MLCDSETARIRTSDVFSLASVRSQSEDDDVSIPEQRRTIVFLPGIEASQSPTTLRLADRFKSARPAMKFKL